MRHSFCEQVEQQMATAQLTVTRLLSLKADADIATKSKVAASLMVVGDARVEGFRATTSVIEMLASCSAVTILKVHNWITDAACQALCFRCSSPVVDVAQD